MEKHDFNWAIEKMRNGFKIRRQHWAKKFFITLDIFNNRFLEMADPKRIFTFKPSTLKADDWELLEEDKRKWMIAFQNDVCLILHKNEELDQYRNLKRVSNKLIEEINGKRKD